MAGKSLEVIQGDTLDLGFRVSGINGVIDFTVPGTELHALVTDLSGRRPLAKFQIIETDPANGEFRIHLDSKTSSALRGKHLWAVRFERNSRTITLAGGQLIVKAGA